MAPVLKAVKHSIIIAQCYLPLRHGVEDLTHSLEAARKFYGFLRDACGYLVENMVYLSDEPTFDDHLATKDNILRQIDIVISKLRPKSGDSLLFYYSGHCFQLVSHSKSEEDGLDEGFLTMDHVGEPFDSQDNYLDPSLLTPLDPDYKKLGGLLLDDVLRERLVDRIPPGCDLVAIADACNSGTVFDLDHYKCNDVWVPWLTRRHRCTRTVSHPRVRRNALDYRASEQRTLSAISENSTQTASFDSQASVKAVKNDIGNRSSRLSLPQLNDTPRRGNSRPLRRNTITPDFRFQPYPTAQITWILDEEYRTSVPGHMLPTEQSNVTVNPVRSVISRRRISPFMFAARHRCSSPKLMPDFKCDGFKCKREPPPDDRRIISISSSSDHESTIDGPELHQNTTFKLIKILEDHQGRKLTLRTLMQELSFSLHEHSVEFLEVNRKWNSRNRMAHREAGLPGNCPSQCGRIGFQTPQLGSLYPLDMDQIFEL